MKVKTRRVTDRRFQSTKIEHINVHVTSFNQDRTFIHKLPAMSSQWTLGFLETMSRSKPSTRSFSYPSELNFFSPWSSDGDFAPEMMKRMMRMRMMMMVMIMMMMIMMMTKIAMMMYVLRWACHPVHHPHERR